VLLGFVLAGKSLRELKKRFALFIPHTLAAPYSSGGGEIGRYLYTLAVSINWWMDQKQTIAPKKSADLGFPTDKTNMVPAGKAIWIRLASSGTTQWRQGTGY
jgi:hypothetical protein